MKQSLSVIIGITVIVALVVSILGGVITANTIKTWNIKSGTEVYTKAEIDNMLWQMGISISNTASKVNQKFSSCDIVHRASIESWSDNSDPDSSCEKICKESNGKCLFSNLEYLFEYTINNSGNLISDVEIASFAVKCDSKFGEIKRTFEDNFNVEDVEVSCLCCYP